MNDAVTATPATETTPPVAALDPARAILNGEQLQLPMDLYIPPDALRVLLETFEGPLDLLLYLIRKQNLDILNIPVAEITRQYMEYVDLMGDMRLELAGEYLVMATMLVEIKSRMLLPRQTIEDELDENDPRAELVRRLQAYERFKNAAIKIEEMPRLERDYFVADALPPDMRLVREQPVVSMDDLMNAVREVMVQTKMNEHHLVAREPLSIRERMTEVLSHLSSDRFSSFSELFTAEEGRMGVVVTLIAVLELVRQASIELTQNEAYGKIYVKAKG